MTTSQLQSFYKAITEAPFIKDYTFEYNKSSNKLDIVFKANSSCMTRHTDTIRGLVADYTTALREYKSCNKTNERLKEYAVYYGLYFNDYITILQQTLDELSETNPEYFV